MRTPLLLSGLLLSASLLAQSPPLIAPVQKPSRAARIVSAVLAGGGLALIAYHETVVASRQEVKYNSASRNNAHLMVGGGMVLAGVTVCIVGCKGRK